MRYVDSHLGALSLARFAVYGQTFLGARNCILGSRYNLSYLVALRLNLMVCPLTMIQASVSRLRRYAFLRRVKAIILSFKLSKVT